MTLNPGEHRWPLTFSGVLCLAEENQSDHVPALLPPLRNGVYNLLSHEVLLRRRSWSASGPRQWGRSCSHVRLLFGDSTQPQCRGILETVHHANPTRMDLALRVAGGTESNFSFVLGAVRDRDHSQRNSIFHRLQLWEVAQLYSADPEQFHVCSVFRFLCESLCEETQKGNRLNQINILEKKIIEDLLEWWLLSLKISSWRIFM